MTNRDKPGCLGSILRVLGIKRHVDDGFPYHLKDDFLTPAEISFYGVLHTATADWCVVLPKVRLGEIFYAQTGDHASNVRATNRISQKHVDFLLCQPGTLRPLMGIELDDSSHQRTDRRERDVMVDRVFEAAGLPLLRMPAQAAYNVRDLATALQVHIRSGQQPVGAAVAAPVGQPPPVSPAEAVTSPPATGNALPASAVSAIEPPACPRCGRPMVLRTMQKEGPHCGKQFWGCQNYPRCRGVRECRPESRSGEH